MNPQRLEEQISTIAKSGEVAAPNTWISSYVVTKSNGKSYRYFRLMTIVRSAEGKRRRKMLKYLGVKDSEAYKRAAKAISRRNRIAVLQRQLKRLSALTLVGKKKKRRTSPLTITESELLMHLQHQLELLNQELCDLKREVLRLKNLNQQKIS